MSETKFTPGPWGARGLCIVAIDHDSADKRETVVGRAERFGPARYAQEPPANARIMAAAPDLYAALRAAERVITATLDAEMSPSVVGDLYDMQRAARAALSKARGEQ